MLEIYVLVEQKKTMAKRLLACFFLAITIAFLLMGCMNMYILPLAFLTGGLWYLFQFRSSKEFEYSYFDGEVRFAKVMNKSRRKSLCVHTMEDVLQIAPAGDRSLYKYETDSSVKKLDYTSGEKGRPYYEIVIKNDADLKLIKFEPDEKYLDAVCMKYAQKVIRA